MDIKQLMIIDRCLRDKSRLWTARDLAEACSDVDKVSAQMVRTNINHLRKRYGAPIELVNRKYYQYTDIFRPKSSNLTNSERLKIGFAVDLIRDYCRLIDNRKAGKLLDDLYEEMVTTFHLPRFIETTEVDLEKFTVRLWVDVDLVDSIKKHPIHKSQQVEMEEIDGSIIILLRLPLTMAFKHYLLDNYPRIKVEYPNSLILDLKRLSAM